MTPTVGVGVLTFNMFQTGRAKDFWRTWDSIQHTGYPAETLVLTNGSTDGTQEVVDDLGGIVDDTRSEIWYGNQCLVDELQHNDIVVLSADDLAYKPGWLAELVECMRAAPDDIALWSGYVEPVWGWNTPWETIEAGGHKAIVRDSVCGSSWAFRSDAWRDWMGPFPRILHGEDLEVCKRVRDRGLRMAAMDLTEHTAHDRSAWGNQSHLSATEFDFHAWGLR